MLSKEELDISDIDTPTKWFKLEVNLLARSNIMSFYVNVYFWLFYIEKFGLLDKNNPLDPVILVYNKFKINYGEISIMDDINRIGIYLNDNITFFEAYNNYYYSNVRVLNAINIIIPNLISIHEIMIERGFDWDYPNLGINLVGKGINEEKLTFIDLDGKIHFKSNVEMYTIRLHNKRIKFYETKSKTNLDNNLITVPNVTIIKPNIIDIPNIEPDSNELNNVKLNVKPNLINYKQIKKTKCKRASKNIIIKNKVINPKILKVNIKN